MGAPSFGERSSGTKPNNQLRRVVGRCVPAGVPAGPLMGRKFMRPWLLRCASLVADAHAFKDSA
jgi:hypothetical protein